MSAEVDENTASVALLDAPVAEAVIRTTPNHPFYVRGRGWVQAQNLEIGDRFRGQDGSEAELIEVVDTGTIERVFNLQISRHRTYFVSRRDGTCAVCSSTMRPGLASGRV